MLTLEGDERHIGVPSSSVCIMGESRKHHLDRNDFEGVLQSARELGREVIKQGIKNLGRYDLNLDPIGITDLNIGHTEEAFGDKEGILQYASDGDTAKNPTSKTNSPPCGNF